MKLTTKIVLGLFISIFLLSFVAIIGFSFLDRGKYDNRFVNTFLSISQENIIAVEIEPYQTIKIDKIQTQDKVNVHPTGTIQLKPINNQEETNKLFLPEELLQFTDIVSLNDTLIIRLKINEIREKYKNTLIEGFNFFVHTNTVDVLCNINGIKVDVSNITTDKIHIKTTGHIEIDSCQVNLIELYDISDSRSFLFKNSKIKELNIDFDQMGSWKIENCEIEVLNLTGSKRHNVSLTPSEAKIMNWIPKNEDAQLTVTLRGDTARIEVP